MVENGSQLTGPCDRLPYKKSIWIITVSSKNLRKLLRVKYGDSLLHQPEVYFFFRETMWESEEEAEQAPTIPPAVGKWGFM